MRINWVASSVPIISLAITTIFFLSILSASIYRTTFFTHTHCELDPTVEFIDNYSLCHKIILDRISSAKESVFIAMSMTSRKVVDIYIDELKKAKERNVNVRLNIYNPNDDVIGYLKNMSIDFFNGYNSYELSVRFDAVVIDNSDSYFVPGLFGSTQLNTIQFITFKECACIGSDIINFFDYYEYIINDSFPTVLKNSLAAQSSGSRPTLIHDDYYSYFAHTPGSIIYPLRYGLDLILIAHFSEQPDEIRIFSRNSPRIPLKQYKRYQSDFSFYILIRGLIMLGKTKIKWLVSEKSEFTNLNSALTSYDNFDMRVYDQKYEGPNFIITKNDTLIFSYSIDTNYIEKYYSLHYNTDSSQIRENLTDYFDNIWNKSKKIEMKWNESII